MRLREREASGMMARIVRLSLHAETTQGTQGYSLLKNDLFYQFNLNSFLLVPVRTFENYKRTERVLSEYYSNFKMRGAGGSLTIYCKSARLLDLLFCVVQLAQF